MPQEDISPPRKIPTLPTGRLPFEPRQREAEVVDPKDPGAQRAFELMKRGGAFSDRIRMKSRQPGRRVSRA
jgi:hypothetical protein